MITTLNRGGAENQLLVLVREQLKQGFLVEVVPLKGEPELQKEFESLGAVVNLSLINHRLITQILRFRNMTSDVGVLHSHLPRAELFSVFAKDIDKSVVTRHNAEPFFPGVPPFLSRFLSKIVLRNADVCIAISKAVENFMRTQNEIDPNQGIQIVHYGYESGMQSLMTKSKKYLSKEFTVGTVARLVPQKDLETLLLAFANIVLNTGNTKCKLIIVGEGPLEMELKKKAIRLGIGSQVEWVGKTQDVNRFYRQFDLFILPSRYEGFGLVLLEAMSHGIPIIAANNSAIPEVLGYDYKFLFETSDALDLEKKIVKIFESDFDFLEYSKQRLRLFHPEVMEKSIEHIYLNS